jgi:hypothetical protein
VPAPAANTATAIIPPKEYTVDPKNNKSLLGTSLRDAAAANLLARNTGGRGNAANTAAGAGRFTGAAPPPDDSSNAFADDKNWGLDGARQRTTTGDSDEDDSDEDGGAPVVDANGNPTTKPKKAFMPPHTMVEAPTFWSFTKIKYLAGGAPLSNSGVSPSTATTGSTTQQQPVIVAVAPQSTGSASPR